MKRTPFLLFILDGLALNPNREANAFYHASTPTLDNLMASYPLTTITTHGERVGLGCDGGVRGLRGAARSDPFVTAGHDGISGRLHNVF